MKHRRSRAGLVIALASLFAVACVVISWHGRLAHGQSARDKTRTAENSKGQATQGAVTSAPPAAVSSAVGPSASSSASDSPPAILPPSGQTASNEAPAAASAAKSADLTSIPLGKGLPVVVSVAVFFLEIKSFDDTKGEVECTTDVRFRWYDPRLRFPESEAIRGYKEYRASSAETELGKLWNPVLDIRNRVEDPSYTNRRLRFMPDGLVELITRTTARYTVNVDAESFPFDRQQLALEFQMREDTTDDVILDFQKDDVEFSRHAESMTIGGWSPGLVNLRRSVIAGWNGDRYSRVQAALDVRRDPSSALTTIFIPLVASLLIPMLAVWMNKLSEDGFFEIEAFELANVIIGGLFSVIALSFAIYSSYGMIAGSDNTVTRLFALNYMALAIALLVVTLFFHYNLPRRFFGPYVQVELYRFVCWALPVLTLGTSIAFILIASA